ncbi:MAG: ComF family protein [Candidatus Pacebacteria bacterium]|nr:ComF family protein [Candidatus Paceibacterota bacterium]
MPKLLTVCIDLLFPPSPEELLIRDITMHTWVTKYQPGHYQGVLFLSQYHDPMIRAAIKENKFHHSAHAAKLLASLLLQHKIARDEKTIFIPIPLGEKRQKDRGHNQVTTVLAAAGLLPRTSSNLLKRITETAPQSHLTKTARAENIHKAFTYLGGGEQLSDFDRVILIDDVVTTGATMRAAASALRPHLPAKVRLECLALAH